MSLERALELAERGRGTTYPTARRAPSAASQPKPPRQSTTRASGASRLSSRCSHGAQVSRSRVVGLLSGGAHRTAATTSTTPISGAAMIVVIMLPGRNASPIDRNHIH